MTSQALASSSSPLHQPTESDDPPVLKDPTRPLAPTGRNPNISIPHLSPASLALLKHLAQTTERSPSLADREFYEACWGKPNGFVVDGIGYIRSNFDLPRTRPIMVREDYVTLYAHLESLPNKQNTDAIVGYGSPGIGKLVRPLRKTTADSANLQERAVSCGTPPIDERKNAGLSAGCERRHQTSS